MMMMMMMMMMIMMMNRAIHLKSDSDKIYLPKQKRVEENRGVKLEENNESDILC